MADFTVTITPSSTGSNPPVVGTPGNDRLFMTYTKNTGVFMNFAGSLAAGYNGAYFGDGGVEDDVSFSGIENFTYDHTTGNGGDSIVAGAGNDAISTGADSDTIASGGGLDTIDGGAGTDTWGTDLSGSSVAVTIELGGVSSYGVTGVAGSASVQNVEGFRNFVGSQAGDTLTSTALSGNTVNGGGGADIITVFGNAGNNSVNGGGGADVLILTYTQPISVANSFGGTLAGGYSGAFLGVGGVEDDSGFEGVEAFWVTTSGGADSLVSGDANDTLASGGGNDTLYSGKGIDAIDGGAEVDTWGADLSDFATGVAINLAGSSSYLTFGSVVNVEGFRNFTGTQGADTLSSTTLSGNTVSGAGGDDTIAVFAGPGHNQVDGGAGSDRLTLTFTVSNSVGTTLGGDFVAGYTGSFLGAAGVEDDATFAGIEAFSITTIGGNDSLATGNGNDSLSSGDGADTMHSGKGIDTINGGLGVDFWGADLTGFNTGVSINLNGSSTFLGTGSVVGVEGFRDFIGTQGQDVLINTSQTGATVNGAGGNDFITVYAGPGNNQIAGGTGSDRLTLVLTQDVSMGTSLAGTFAAGYQGNFNGAAGVEDDTAFSGIEHFSLTMAAGNDAISTGDGRDAVIAGAGNDTINTGGGLDSVNGGAGIDTWGADLSASSVGVTINLSVLSNYSVSGNPNLGLVVGFEGLRNFVGSQGNDTLTSTMLSGNTVNGAGGDDTIAVFAGPGHNQVEGGAGSDRLVLTQTAASDMTTSLGGNLVDGFQGNFNGAAGIEDDTGFNGIDAFSLTTLGGNDSLATGGGNDLISSGGGNDTLHSGGGVDTINGGAGTDTWGADLSAFTTGVAINLNGGSSFLGSGSVTGVEGFRNFLGTQGNDTLTATALSGSTVNGGGGNDVLTVYQAGGNNQVEGGAGNDVLVAVLNVSSTYSLGGNAIDGYFGGIFGPAGGEDDIGFSGIERFSVLWGGGGNFTFSGGENADTIRGGVGNDTLNGAGGNDLVYAVEGNDLLNGGAGVDTLVAGLGADTLNGGDDNDVLYGEGGDDVFQGGAGNDQFWGADGLDTADYGDQSAAVRVLLGVGTGDAGSATGAGIGTDSTRSVENATGGSGNDTIQGSSAANVLLGGGGNDLIYGLVGTDRLEGGDGNDSLVGGLGGDTLRGGDGLDVMYGEGGDDVFQDGLGNDQFWGAEGIDAADYSGQSAAVRVILGLGAGDAGWATGSGIGTDGLRSIENASGGSGNDTITGSSSANLLNGGAGIDILDGAAGNDTLEGGAGRDILYGRADADVFVYRLASDSNLSTGYDTIADFQTGLDKLDFDAFGITAAQVLVQSGASSTVLYADTDAGTAGYELAISFAGANAIDKDVDIIF